MTDYETRAGGDDCGDDDGGDDNGGVSRRRILKRGGTAAGTVAVAGCLRSGVADDSRRPSVSGREGREDSERRDGRDDPLIIGHRGCAAEHPENTVAAVGSAAAVADAVEVDVRRCGTGELVVFHDETLDRLTDASGRVDETDCGTVRGLEIGDTGETIPALGAVFEATPPGVGLVLDLKTDGLIDDVLELANEHGRDPLLSSFLPSVLADARAADPTVSTALIVRESRRNRVFRPVVPGAPGWLYAPENVDRLVRTAVDLGCDALHPRYELCLRTRLVERAHAAGLAVEPWTITTRREYDALSAVGVDAVISDVCSGLRD